MQVKCSKCSEPITLTDIIESSEGRLSHVDCTRPNTLTMEERGLLYVYCSGHPVAYCLGCDLRFRLSDLGTDWLGGRTDLCTRCRTDLTASARAHLFGCAMLPSEVRLRAKAVREAAHQLVKHYSSSGSALSEKPCRVGQTNRLRASAKSPASLRYTAALRILRDLNA